MLTCNIFINLCSVILSLDDFANLFVVFLINIIYLEERWLEGDLIYALACVLRLSQHTVYPPPTAQPRALTSRRVLLEVGGMRSKNGPIFKIKWGISFPIAFRPMNTNQKKFFKFLHFWRFAAQKSGIGGIFTEFSQIIARFAQLESSRLLLSHIWGLYHQIWSRGAQ